MQKRYPKIKLLLVDSVIKGTMAVSKGKADALINSVGSLSHVMSQISIPNVKIIRDVAIKEIENPALHIGVHRQNAILRDILDKGILAVSEKEQNALRKDWLPLL